MDIRAIGEGDVISIGGVDMELQPITKRQEQLQSQLRTGGSSGWSGLLGLLILTLLQAVMLTGFLLNGPEEEFGAYFLASAPWRCASGAVLFLSGHSPPLL